MSITTISEDDMGKIVDEVFSDGQLASVEDAYQRLAKLMFTYFSQNGKSELVLSRVYHSFNLLLLPESLQHAAKETWGDILDNDKLIVLLGTYGIEKNWQDRHQSRGHKAILLNHETINKIPMVSRLLKQIGINFGPVEGNSRGIEFEGISGTFGVFYVSPAKESPFIPAQDFVEKYDVQTVFGTGVMLPQGDIALYIGFSCLPVKKEIACNIAPLMSLFWQKASSLLESKGMFNE